MKADVVIPTWNSMPEFKRCLQSIDKNIPPDVVDKVIVVDRSSTDGTVETAKKHGCIVINDEISLGSARMRGWEAATSDVILFVDSDIEIRPGWYPGIIRYWDDDVGMLFGRTVDSSKYGKIKEYKIERDFGDADFRLLNVGDRGFTHNTFVRRRLLKGLDISWANAWEDYVITQHVLGQGYMVVETRDVVTHLHDEVASAKVAWNIQGILNVKGSFVYALGFWNYYLWEGLRSAVHFRDVDMLRWGFLNWLEGFRAFGSKNARRHDD